MKNITKKSREMSFDRVLIIGLGLIGGSFARVLRQRGLSKEIIAQDVHLESLELAKNLGVIDEILKGKSGFDLIVIATPLSEYDKVFQEIENLASDQTIIIDLGSIKDLKFKNFPEKLLANFVPSHPIAGLEKGGFVNSYAELFFRKKFIICPENSSQEALKKVVNLIEQIGGNVELMAAKRHDEIYGLISHFPQLLSFITSEFSPKNVAGDFFREAFRLDNSSTEIWENAGGIFVRNQSNLQKFYAEFFVNLGDFEEEIIANEHLSYRSLEGGSEGCVLSESDLEFFTKNFPTIFFRILIVLSYLEITEVKTFASYAGTGFKSFTSIIEVLHHIKSEDLKKLITQHQKQVIDLVSIFKENHPLPLGI